MGLTAEELRLEEARDKGAGWRDWGPYLSERQWGTVGEDYSDSGDAWDNKQQLCFALALWNGVDPILKEWLFGLTNSEGNHGEDVKEYYLGGASAADDSVTPAGHLRVVVNYQDEQAQCAGRAR